jgi:hypothetical protein
MSCLIIIFIGFLYVSFSISKIEKLMNIQNNYLHYEDICDKEQVTILPLDPLYENIDLKIDFYLDSETMKQIKQQFWENKDKNVLAKKTFLELNIFSKIFFVKYESQADLKVYFVDYESRAGWKNNSKKHLLY